MPEKAGAMLSTNPENKLYLSLNLNRFRLDEIAVGEKISRVLCEVF